MSSITICIEDENPHRTSIVVRTTTRQPAVGQPLTPAEALAMDLLHVCRSRAMPVHYGYVLPSIEATLGSDPVQGTVQGSAA